MTSNVVVAKFATPLPVFSIAQEGGLMQSTRDGVQQAVDDVNQKVEAFRTEVNKFIQAAFDAAVKIGAAIGTAFTAGIEQLKTLVQQVMAWVNDKVKMVKAPLDMFHDAQVWQQARAAALQLAADLEPVRVDPSSRFIGAAHTSAWTGRAADAYSSVVGDQHNAAVRISTLANEAVGALLALGSLGLTFYLGIARVLYNLILAVGLVLKAVFTSPLTVLDALSSLGKAIADQIPNLVGLGNELFISLQTQNTAGTGMIGVTSADNDFPGNKWPDPTTYKNWQDAYHPGPQPPAIVP